MRIAEREIKRATVLGYGRTGRAVAAYLLDHDVEVFVSDSGALSRADEDSLSKRQVPFEQGGHTLRALDGADVVVLSPGIRPDLSILNEARERSIQIISELDLAYWNALNTRIIAVTGTNGKSTTVKLVEGILKSEGIKAVAAGNIGLPFITLADDPPDVVVLEVSSFQLEQSSMFHPHVACLLNIAPDHLDRHGSMDRYVAAKLSIFDRQRNSDLAVVSRDLPLSRASIAARLIYFDDIVLPVGKSIDSLLPHDRSNLKAAISCCRGILPDLDATKIDIPALEGAFHLPYRMQEEPPVRGVRVINDSKSTNAASAITALAAVDGPCILILGGRHKGAGYDDLACAIMQRDVRSVILFGEGKHFLSSALRDVSYAQTSLCSDLESALKLALRRAGKGDTILFSPACSSYDQYDSFLERGEHFSRLIRSFLGQESSI